MTKLTVYDPAMCCSTGKCRTDVHQKPIPPAADLDCLRAQGVHLQRVGPSRESAEFIASDLIRDLIKASGGDDLPAVVLQDKLVAKALYLWQIAGRRCYWPPRTLRRMSGRVWAYRLATT